MFYNNQSQFLPCKQRMEVDSEIKQRSEKYAMSVRNLFKYLQQLLLNCYGLYWSSLIYDLYLELTTIKQCLSTTYQIM